MRWLGSHAPISGTRPAAETNRKGVPQAQTCVPLTRRLELGYPVRLFSIHIRTIRWKQRLSCLGPLRQSREVHACPGFFGGVCTML